MRLVEIACIPIYFYSILTSIELVNLAMIRNETLNPDNKYIMGTFTASELGPSDSPLMSEKKCSKTDFNSFAGRTPEWLIIEIAVFGFFLVTMLFTMIKSRFITVGIDNSA